jgi:hypothetical protein
LHANPNSPFFLHADPDSHFVLHAYPDSPFVFHADPDSHFFLGAILKFYFFLDADADLTGVQDSSSLDDQSQVQCFIFLNSVLACIGQRSTIPTMLLNFLLNTDFAAQL